MYSHGRKSLGSRELERAVTVVTVGCPYFQKREVRKLGEGEAPYVRVSRNSVTIVIPSQDDWQLLGRYSTLFKTAEKRLESTFPPDRTTATLRPRILSFS